MSNVNIDQEEFGQILNDDSSITAIFDRDYDFAGKDTEYVNSLFMKLGKLVKATQINQTPLGTLNVEYVDILIEAIYEAPNFQTVEAILSRVNFQNIRIDSTTNLIRHSLQVLSHFIDHLNILELERPDLAPLVASEIKNLQSRNSYYVSLLHKYSSVGYSYYQDPVPSRI